MTVITIRVDAPKTEFFIDLNTFFLNSSAKFPIWF